MIMRRAVFAVVVAFAVVAQTSVATAAGGGGGGGGTGADLQITGSASTGSPGPTQSYWYTYLIKNSGPQTATSVVFSTPLPAGTTLNWAQVQNFAFAINCTTAPDASGVTVISCNLPDMLSGTQLNVLVDVSAPPVAATVSATGIVSSAVADPKPSNNSVTVNVQVKNGACAVPAGQPTLYGIVMQKGADIGPNGMFDNFSLQVNGVNYWVTTNFFDGTAPLTSVINLSCQQSPVQFIQTGNFVYVTGVVNSATHTINASIVQVLTFKDAA